MSIQALRTEAGRNPHDRGSGCVRRACRVAVHAVEHRCAGRGFCRGLRGALRQCAIERGEPRCGLSPRPLPTASPRFAPMPWQATGHTRPDDAVIRRQMLPRLALIRPRASLIFLMAGHVTGIMGPPRRAAQARSPCLISVRVPPPAGGYWDILRLSLRNPGAHSSAGGELAVGACGCWGSRGQHEGLYRNKRHTLTKVGTSTTLADFTHAAV